MNKEMCNHGIPRGRNRSSMGGGGPKHMAKSSVLRCREAWQEARGVQ